MRQIKAIVIHCAATPDGDARFDRTWCDILHRKKGWRMIGYHRYIEISGLVVVGRKLKEIGAHVSGQNSRTVGICIAGMSRFTLPQWESLANQVNDLQDLYPTAEVKGHRDYSPDLNGDGIIEPWEYMKECPCFDVATWLAGAKQPLAGHIFVPDNQGEDNVPQVP